MQRSGHFAARVDRLHGPRRHLVLIGGDDNCAAVVAADERRFAATDERRQHCGDRAHALGHGPLDHDICRISMAVPDPAQGKRMTGGAAHRPARQLAREALLADRRRGGGIRAGRGA